MLPRKEIKGFSRVTKTTAGRTGIGMEVEVKGMEKKADLSSKQYDFFINNGFRYMMPKYENYKLVRLPFFYKSYDTEEEREKEYSILVKKLISDKKPEEPKAEMPKLTSGLKIVDGLLTNAKPLDKLTKAELITLYEAATSK